MRVTVVSLEICIQRLLRKLVCLYGNADFLVNSGRTKIPSVLPRGQILEDQLHSYTIVDAINDKNVLTFRVDYIKTMDGEEEITDEMVWDINREKIL